MNHPTMLKEVSDIYVVLVSSYSIDEDMEVVHAKLIEHMNIFNSLQPVEFSSFPNRTFCLELQIYLGTCFDITIQFQNPLQSSILAMEKPQNSIPLRIGKPSICTRLLCHWVPSNNTLHFVRESGHPLRMKIAVEGCMHGDLDNVYGTLQYIERRHNTKIDLLLCCGDFQAVRNEHDLKSLKASPEYRKMNSFWKYYSGEAIAPYPTIFIGGNHEASNYLWELYYGGWVAPNIYFLGFAGVLKFGNLRIGGLSGIYKPKDYSLRHYERPPYNEDTIRSIYHVREYDVHKLMQVEEPIDIFLSHDRPVRIYDYGDLKQLLQKKPHFEQDIKNTKLGSKAAADLLEKLKPPYWFSAHLHCKFAARVQHWEGGPVTNFLALDKCGEHRDFLQVIDVESGPGPYEIQYDEEWLQITRRFNPAFPLTVASANFSNVYLDKEASRNWVRSKLQARGARPFEFCQTAPSHNPSKKSDDSSGAFHVCPRNPQTESLLKFLELPYLLDNTSESSDAAISSFPSSNSYNSPEEIFIDDVDESDPEE